MAPSSNNALVLPLIILIVMLLGVAGFGTWAFMGRQDYKNNVDQKITEAVEVAEGNLIIKKDAEFAEAYKLPYVIYKGPSALGSIAISYPKTWSNYVEEKAGSMPLNGFMQPSFVSVSTNDTNYALRYQIIQKNYDQEVKNFESKVKSGKVAVAAYRLPKQESVLGVKITGEVDAKKDGVLVILPLRDKIIKIWTEGNEFRTDFEEILNQLTFIP